MKRMLYLIVVGILSLIIIKTTTFGWRLMGGALSVSGKDYSQLAGDLKKHVYKLSHEIGERNLFNYKNLDDTAAYIVAQLSSFSYSLEFQEYYVLDKKVKNIIATKAGIEKPENIIIVGAHYDTCFNPGANDNASGIAGLLELARMMANQSSDQTIEFIAFTNEEPPFFRTEDMGSRVYAKAAKAQNKNIRAVIVLETIGYYTNKAFSQRYPPLIGFFYPNRGNFIAVVHCYINS